MAYADRIVGLHLQLCYPCTFTSSLSVRSVNLYIHFPSLITLTVDVGWIRYTVEVFIFAQDAVTNQTLGVQIAYTTGISPCVSPIPYFTLVTHA